MSQPADQLPKHPAKRVAHRAHKAAGHHAAHRKRVQAQAEEHFKAPPPPPQ